MNAETKNALSSDFEGLDSPLQSRDILFTGFPGFIGARLLHRLIPVSDDDVTFYFLIEPSRMSQAKSWLSSFESAYSDFDERYELLPGDITKQRLGFDKETYESVTDNVGVVWHLAAIYDLGVPEQIGYEVNVEGTKNMIDFCQDCDELERFNYVSTCYVSGDRTDRIFEDELDEGQSHHNFYESTKFWAEVEVQKHWEEIPTAIFRPSMVVGDSTTGETNKYDGPYYIFKLLHKLPDWLPITHFGDGEVEANVVPVDFVTEAMAYLGVDGEADGKVYQLADPNPMQAREVVNLIIECMNRASAMGQVPASIAEMTFKSKFIQEWTGIPEEAIIYFNEAGHFDTSNTDKALEGTSIESPHLTDYMQNLVDYFLRHPDSPGQPV